MRDDVVSVREAAIHLGVSPQRVRRLIHDQVLPARRTTAGWLVQAEAVREQAAGRSSGRPVAPVTTWAVLRILADPQAHMERRLRHRARQTLAALPDPESETGPWRTLLRGRAVTERFWVHPGVIPAVQADARVSRSGADLLGQARLSPTRHRVDLYLAHDNLAALIKDYRMRADREGVVVVHGVPVSVPAELAPACGEAVPALVAAADFLDDDDPRARDAAVRELRDAWAEGRREARS